MDVNAIVDKVRAIAEGIAQERGLELVNAEFASGPHQPVIRIFLDRPDGVTHQDCAAVSFQLGTMLDSEDFIPVAYTLEVSSPGLERELFKLSEYERYTGSLAKIRANQPLAGQRNFRGRIAGVSGNRIVFQDRTKGLVEIPFETIAKAQLEIDLDEELRRAKERQQ